MFIRTVTTTHEVDDFRQHKDHGQEHQARQHQLKHHHTEGKLHQTQVTGQQGHGRQWCHVFHFWPFYDVIAGSDDADASCQLQNQVKEEIDEGDEVMWWHAVVVVHSATFDEDDEESDDEDDEDGGTDDKVDGDEGVQWAGGYVEGTHYNFGKQVGKHSQRQNNQQR